MDARDVSTSECADDEVMVNESEDVDGFIGSNLMRSEGGAGA
jgi:hypothetical protein